jgi:hypothetical protein
MYGICEQAGRVFRPGDNRVPEHLAEYAADGFLHQRGGHRGVFYGFYAGLDGRHDKKY